MDKFCAKRKRYARQQLERLIKQALLSFGKYERHEFLLLLNRFRHASGLHDSPLSDGQTCAHSCEMVVRAMTRIVRDRRYWVRDLYDWEPANFSSLRQYLSSLVHHLFASHSVPAFLTAAWWSDSDDAKTHCKWFRHLGQGHSILGLNHPQVRTKAIAQRFLNAPAHFTVKQAITWAQRPIVDKPYPSIFPYGFSNRRQKRVRAQIANREHLDLWKTIGVKEFNCSEIRLDRVCTWQIRQIRCESKLIEEGAAMKHCVAGYAACCRLGRTTIWSMTCKYQQSNYLPTERLRALTIEVLPNRLVQTALGYQNRDPTEAEREILEKWAAQEELKISQWV